MAVVYTPPDFRSCLPGSPMRMRVKIIDYRSYPTHQTNFFSNTTYFLQAFMLYKVECCNSRNLSLESMWQESCELWKLSKMKIGGYARSFRAYSNPIFVIEHASAPVYRRITGSCPKSPCRDVHGPFEIAQMQPYVVRVYTRSTYSPLAAKKSESIAVRCVSIDGVLKV